MTLPLKKCPSCKFWWFDRQTYGCTKQYGRVTYPTTEQGRVELENICCSDFRSRKMYDYLLQKKETKQSDRMIREGEDGEIENEKVSKSKRKMTIDKRRPKKKSEEVIPINKPKRMIRIENHDWLE